MPHAMMNTNNYASPQCEVIEMKAQELLCQSGVTTTNPFAGGTEELWTS